MSIEIYVQIGIRLKHSRIKAGYKTSASFADTLRINKPTYSNHENGNKAISLETIIEYAKHLDVSWQYLITGNIDEESGEINSLDSTDGVILDQELLSKILVAVDEVTTEKGIKMSFFKKADLIYSIYISVYDRYKENSRFSIKDAKMCVNAMIRYDSIK